MDDFLRGRTFFLGITIGITVSRKLCILKNDYVHSSYYLILNFVGLSDHQCNTKVSSLFGSLKD